MYSLVLATMLSTTATAPQQVAAGWGSCYGCYGYGGAFGCAGGAFACMGCYGGYQSWWGGAGGFGGYGAHVGGPAPHVACCEAPAPAPAPAVAEGEDAAATVVVHLPVDAQLFVEGKPVTLDPALGGFRTPKLAPGSYVYTLRTEVVRDGKLVVESKEVSIAPGNVSRVRFGDPGAITPVAARERSNDPPVPAPRR